MIPAYALTAESTVLQLDGTWRKQVSPTFAGWLRRNWGRENWLMKVLRP